MNLKTTIASVFKVLAIVLSLSVLLPSAIKLSHAFNHHKHEVCENDNNSNTHFHASDLDCDFYKFKLNKNQYFLTYEYDERFDFYYLSKLSSYYISLDNHQYSTQYLRGPPQFI